MSQRVEHVIHYFPQVLCDLIAVLALSDEFEVEIAEYEYKKYYPRDLTVTLPGYTFVFSDHNLEGRPSLPFFSTIGDIVTEDRDLLEYHCRSEHGEPDPFNVIHFFRWHTIPTYDIRNHDHLSYYSYPTLQLLTTSDELAHDVRLWDLRAVNTDGKRRIHRRLQDPFVTRDIEDPWCCGKREGGGLLDD